MNMIWYANRLSVMGLSEALHRLVLKLKSLAWRNGLLMPQNRPLFNAPYHISNYPFDFCSFKDAIIEEANGYLLNRWCFFGYNISEKEIIWSFDPVNGKTCSNDFSLSLNHRDRAFFGDAKNIWEKNRLHHLVVLACAFKLTAETKYVEVIEKQIVSWIKENRFLYGPNWTHPLESAIRLISLIWIFRLTEKSDLISSLNKIVPLGKIIYMHIWFIYENQSVGSSANNHLIGEIVGLIVGCSFFPNDKKLNKWEMKCTKKLERELLRQTYPCGMNKELGYEYHLFVVEFVLILIHERRIMGKDDNPVYKDVLVRMSQVLRHLRSIYGVVPSYGDGDSGLVLQMYPRNCNRETLLLDAVEKIAPSAVKPDDSFTRSIIKDVGVLHYSADSRNCRIGLFFDAGSFGMEPLYAHGHADALSFCLNVNGQPVFIDSGTYTYFGDPRARSYFRSTRAHNTLCIDKLDQCRQTGRFMWRDIAKTSLKLMDIKNNELSIIATHNGYKKQGIIHSRMLQYVGKRITIIDKLEGKGCHTIEISFHLNPECMLVDRTEVVMKFVLNNQIVSISFPTGCEIYHYFGSANIDEGWYSPAFGILKPCHTIRCKVLRKTFPFELKTEIEVGA